MVHSLTDDLLHRRNLSRCSVRLHTKRTVQAFRFTSRATTPWHYKNCIGPCMVCMSTCVLQSSYVKLSRCSNDPNWLSCAANCWSRGHFIRYRLALGSDSMISLIEFSRLIIPHTDFAQAFTDSTAPSYLSHAAADLSTAHATSSPDSSSSSQSLSS